MNFRRKIWYLFKLNRNDFNKADKKIERVLIDVYNKGRKDGKDEALRSLQFHLRDLIS